MPTEKTIRSFWNRAAEANPHWYVSSYGSYDADRNLDEFWASGGTIWNDIKRVIGYTPESSDTVVEIGCGVGRLTRVIAPEVRRVIALDISEKMLAIARQATYRMSISAWRKALPFRVFRTNRWTFPWVTVFSSICRRVSH